MSSKMHRSGRREEKSGGRNPALFETLRKSASCLCCNDLCVCVPVLSTSPREREGIWRDAEPVQEERRGEEVLASECVWQGDCYGTRVLL